MEQKELKELLVGILKLSQLMASVFKDGVQASDLATIFAKIEGDAELKAALIAAYNDAGKAMQEAKDLKAADAVELLIVAMPELKTLIEILGSKA